MQLQRQCFKYKVLHFVLNLHIFAEAFFSRTAFPRATQTLAYESRNRIEAIPYVTRPSSTFLCLSPQAKNNDMTYTETNIKRQLNFFTQIQNVGDSNVVNDVYARDPKRNIWWYVGKSARCTGTVTLQQAISRQYQLIEEHACRLRPVELGREIGKLEIWGAPYNSEQRVAQNDPSVLFEKMPREVKGDEDVSAIEVGFNCEFVTNKGVGFRVERRDDGSCL